MKAIVWEGINSIRFADVPEPECKDGWVKIKVMSVGLCATEAHIISGKFDGGKPPHILGHEVCGDIVELGKNCNEELLGKRVVVETYVGCGKCLFCRTGRKHLCSAGEIGYPPYNGGDAQYVVVPQGCVRIIPDCISYDEGGIMEAVACPFGALLSAGFKMGSTVLIQGAGVAGLSFIQSAKAAGAKKVICAVRNDVKAAQSRHFGADVVIDLRREDLISRVIEETDGLGVDFSIDAAGAPQTIENAVKTAMSGGHVILYGIPSNGANINFPVTEMILRQITVCGYTGNEFAWDSLIALVAESKINLRDMVSYKFPLSEFENALNLMENKPQDLIKIVLHPWEEIKNSGK